MKVFASCRWAAALLMASLLLKGHSLADESITGRDRSEVDLKTQILQLETLPGPEDYPEKVKALSKQIEAAVTASDIHAIMNLYDLGNATPQQIEEEKLVWKKYLENERREFDSVSFTSLEHERQILRRRSREDEATNPADYPRLQLLGTLGVHFDDKNGVRSYGFFRLVGLDPSGVLKMATRPARKN